ncbi:tumor necrosis factor receptor superfamily member 16-like [Corythoichthys intestinalis]|uniref:tumor necrosis factor receptor superfamily member 16-like n=1 Tax=Corythoichthys intestinalis TaxID=161448 RepID=UPI0025A5F21D|nr:tumor necrosis factor receptor superfamily member 16-like [Corythoichthys intestinalis]
MGRIYAMNMILMTVLLGLARTSAKEEKCLSGQYTTDGKCCKQCPPGEGVVKPCGATQPVCAPCLDSETFSENFSHTERCQPCTKCTGLFRMETPCTDSNDAICVCNYGFYLNELSQRCEPCTKCPVGQGMLLSCEPHHDTMCEECGGDTYSDQESSREPCIPCTTCEEGEELLLQACTAVTDTVCQEQYPSISPTPFTAASTPTYDDFPVGSPPSDGPTDDDIGSSTTVADVDSHERIYHNLNDKLIPVYCSVLAAIVVGLVAFVVFKRWNSCKQNKQQANNCTSNPNQTPSPEGEKLHSDSGISVDSQSLQEQLGQNQTHTVVTLDEDPCLLLPLHTRDKVEQLLFNGADEGETEDDWRNLAGLLGYEEERIAAFRRDEHPVRALLSDWAAKDCASVDALRTALRKINRNDIAQSLALAPAAPKPTATSVV